MTVERDARRRGRAASCCSGRPAAAAGARKVARVLGRPDVARDVIEALMLDRGLRRALPARRRAGGEARRPTRPATTPPRRDLRDLPTFTIDPATARDFDDAISAEALGDEPLARLGPHRRRQRLRAAGRRRSTARPTGAATSVYVPGAVEPMLPEALSNDACSLVPGVDRLAVTVEMELRRRGRRARARSTAR